MQDFQKLTAILKDNAETDIGRKYGFGNIMTPEAWQNKVPVTGYDTYAPLIELTTRVGEIGIFVGEPVTGYALTSGTTGVPRLIPCTKKHIADYAEAFEGLSVHGSTLLLFESMPRNTRYADNAPLDSIMGLLLTEVQKKLKDDSHKRIFAGGAVTSPIELLVTREVMDNTHLRLLFALIDKNVEQIIAPFTWGVLEMFTYLENNWKRIVEDIRTGEISKSVSLSDELRTALTKKLKANPKRADELEAIFSEGFEKPVIQKIWPNFLRVIAAGTGSFSIYTEQLRRYIGSVQHRNGFYAASEGVIGKDVFANMELYTLNRGSSVVEFIPVKGEDKTPIPAEMMQVGEEYEVIITNCAGLYRYRLGDVVGCCLNSGEDVQFFFRYRRNQAWSFADENMNEYHLTCAVRAAAKAMGVTLSDFCFMPDEDGERYTVLLETTGHRADTEKLQALGVEAIAAEMEKQLQEINPVYAALRAEGKLNACSVLMTQPQTQLLYRDVQKIRRRTAPDQIKPVRLIDNPVKEKFFFSMLDEQFHDAAAIRSYMGRYKK